MEEIVYVNGSLVPASEARVSAFDHGFLYGYGLFETMRAYGGRIFLLERHLERLRRGAASIGLQAKLEGIDLSKACRETVAANGNGDLRVRLTVTGGDAPAFPWDDTGTGPTVVVSARAYTGPPAEKFASGYRAVIASVTRCADSPLSGVKSVNYLVSVLARKEAAALGLDEALLLNDRGFIAEGGNSNVFFVQNGELLTPALGSGILPGITRELVVELAAGAGLTCREIDIKPEELASFDEAFFTSSAVEIVPLVEIWMGDSPLLTVGNGQPGRVTKRLMAAYGERVRA